MVVVAVLTEHLLLFFFTFLFPPVLAVVLLVVALATFGKSLGLRQQYVIVLLRIFEWASHEMYSIRSVNAADAEGTEESSGTEYSTDNDGDMAVREEDEDDHLKRVRHGSGASIIKRVSTITRLNEEEDIEAPLVVKSKGWRFIADSFDYVKLGFEAIIEDEVTSRFEAEQLACWNMLARTSVSFGQLFNWKLRIIWVFGFLFRYLLLFPLRVTLFTIGIIFLLASTALVGVLPSGSMKRSLNHSCMLICYRILSRCVSAVITFYDVDNRARSGGICVANHTSPIDVMILSTDNVYALVGQQHGGLLGLIQRALSRASAHIWFDRSETRDLDDRFRLQEHVNDPRKLPILIFPEGTCINNTSVMQFKKGSFEIGTKIYPIAMKYDSRFGDAFWNSSEQGWGEYLLRMMTSWAIICHVWYLPPMERWVKNDPITINDFVQENEDAVSFASRVKKEICKKGGLVDLEWDGQLKRIQAPLKMKAEQQNKYYQRMMARYVESSEDEGGGIYEDFSPGLEMRPFRLSRTGSDVESSIVSDPGIGSSVPSPPGTVGNNSGQASDYEDEEGTEWLAATDNQPVSDSPTDKSSPH